MLATMCPSPSLPSTISSVDSRNGPHGGDYLRVFDLIKLAHRDLEMNQRSYANNFPHQMKHLLSFLGETRARDVSFEVVENYKLTRIRDGAARSTINNELSGLSKGFRIALRAKLIPGLQQPYIMRLRPGRPRTGFLYVEEFRRILSELPPDPGDVADFAYWSGWRRGEIFGLRWECTSDEWAWCYDKNSSIKNAPLKGHLREIFNRRREKRIAGCPWVFHRDGKTIKCMRKAWIAAVRRAGVSKKWFHDTRRSFCRNAIRAGVDRDTVMKLSGHKTDYIFRAYNIQDEDDLKSATKKMGEM